MFRTGLSEPCEILGYGKITRHPDLLTTSDPHPVHPANNRFVVHEDGGDHVVEKTHVLFVFLGIAGIIFSIFLRVSPSAERFIPHRSEYDSNDTPVVGSFPHGKDYLFDRVGRIGVILQGIVQNDPGVEHAFYGIALKILAGPFFKQDLLV